MAYMLLFTWCVAAVTAKQYGEYPDVHIPNYGIPNEYEGIRDGSPSDEYSGHLHDASIPLDYKYEEDSHRKTAKSNIDTYDSEWWMKRAKSQRGALRSPEDSIHAKNKFNREDDKAQNIKSNHRYSKQRTRQDVNNEGDEKPSARRSKKYSQNRKDVSDIDRKEYVDKEFTDSKHKYSDVDESSYVDSFTRIKSLKHRGRHRKDIENDLELTRFDPETIDSDAYEDDDAQIEKRLKGHVDKIITNEKREHRLAIPESDDVMDSDLRESEHDRVATYYPKFEAFTKPTRDRPMIQKRPLLLNTKDKFRLSYDDVDDNEPAEKKLKSKPDDYYSNYYERVQNMKSKITSHITRTTAQAKSTETMWFQKQWTDWRKIADYSDDEDYQVGKLAHRTKTSSSLTSTTSSNTKMEDIVNGTFSISIKSTTRNNSTENSTFSNRTTTAISLSWLGNYAGTLPEPRLSVLKNAENKEELLSTFVMVEESNTRLPWWGLNKPAEDSPDEINKVKRLMRKKLVAESKNMKELIKDRDTMVCDYVDTSILDNTSNKLKSSYAVLLFCVVNYSVVSNLVI